MKKMFATLFLTVTMLFALVPSSFAEDRTDYNSYTHIYCSITTDVPNGQSVSASSDPITITAPAGKYISLSGIPTSDALKAGDQYEEIDNHSSFAIEMTGKQNEYYGNVNFRVCAISTGGSTNIYWVHVDEWITYNGVRHAKTISIHVYARASKGSVSPGWTNTKTSIRFIDMPVKIPGPIDATR